MKSYHNRIAKVVTKCYKGRREYFKLVSVCAGATSMQIDSICRFRHIPLPVFCLDIQEPAMKPIKVATISLAIILGVTACEIAIARNGGGHGRGGGHTGGRHSGHPGHHHSHGSYGHLGGFLGGATLGFGYFYPPPNYYPWPVELPYSLPGYIEQGADLYYCTSAQSYYPEVTDCPEGWQAITPEPTPVPQSGR